MSAQNPNKLIGPEFGPGGEPIGVGAGRFELRGGLWRPREAQPESTSVAAAIASDARRGFHIPFFSDYLGWNSENTALKKAALALVTTAAVITAWNTNYQHDSTHEGGIYSERWRSSTRLPLSDSKFIIGATRRVSNYENDKRALRTSSFNFEGPKFESSGNKDQFFKGWLNNYAGGKATP